MKLKFSSYTIIARFFPCIITALPLFVLWYFISDIEELRNLASFLSSLKFYGAISLSVVFLYLFAQIIRITSKLFQKKYFINHEGFPTTYLMYYRNNQLSKDVKDKYREKIKRAFDLDLLNEQEEKVKAAESRKRLDEATQLVISHIGKGKLIEKHNIWYGFFRNLIGGTIYSLIFCILNIVVGFIFPYRQLIIYSVVMFIIYLFVFVFRRQILMQNAEAYAKKLIFEFIALK